jgi:hypothetical protein
MLSAWVSVLFLFAERYSCNNTTYRSSWIHIDASQSLQTNTYICSIICLTSTRDIWRYPGRLMLQECTYKLTRKHNKDLLSRQHLLAAQLARSSRLPAGLSHGRRWAQTGPWCQCKNNERHTNRTKHMYKYFMSLEVYYYICDGRCHAFKRIQPFLLFLEMLLQGLCGVLGRFCKMIVEAIVETILTRILP